MKNDFTLTAKSAGPKETYQIALDLGKSLSGGEILALEGNLGSGKTLFVKGLAEGLGLNPDEIRSPTFALIQEHRGRIPLCHADLYRLASPEAKALGLEEYWSEGSKWVSAVEWADRAQPLFPRTRLWIRFDHAGPLERTLTFSGDKLWKTILKKS